MAVNRKAKNAKKYRNHALTIFGTKKLQLPLIAIAVISLAVVILFSHLPAERELARLRGDLATANEALNQAMETKDCLQIKHRSLLDDPEYIEIMSRDRVPWYELNETIFEIRR